MESVTPYGCTAQVILLLFLYILCLSFIVLAGNLLPGKNRGLVAGLLFCLYGFLLEPKVLRVLLGFEEYEMFRVNVLIGWISPLVMPLMAGIILDMTGFQQYGSPVWCF